MQLEGKQVVVTGAGSGIGRAAAELFAKEGATVVAVDLDAEGANATASAVGATAVVGSASDARLWDDVLSVFGGVDLAYLNAGLYGFNGPIDDLPVDVYRNTVSANIDGVVLGTKALVPSMRARGGGSIVVTASVAGIIAFEGNPVYTMTKHAVVGFVRSIASSLQADGISIDAVCPAVVDTPMTGQAAGGVDPTSLGIDLISPSTIAQIALDLATTDGTGRCRAVRQDSTTVDWQFPEWRDLVRAD